MSAGTNISGFGVQAVWRVLILAKIIMSMTLMSYTHEYDLVSIIVKLCVFNTFKAC